MIEKIGGQGMFEHTDVSCGTQVTSLTQNDTVCVENNAIRI